MPSAAAFATRNSARCLAANQLKSLGCDLLDGGRRKVVLDGECRRGNHRDRF
jgi:hypothetical protein